MEATRGPRTAELRVVLQDVIGRHLGAPRRIASLERRPSAYRTSFALEELDVRLEDGTTLALIFKDVSQEALLVSARQAKPDFLLDPLREIEVYRAILAPQGLGPTWYGAAVDPEAGRSWLFLERVPGIELYQVGDLAVWKAVAHWLAALHERFAGCIDALAEVAHLLRYDGTLYRRWMERAKAFIHQAGEQDAMRGIDWLAERYEAAVEQLVALPSTFIHGEFFASNVLVRQQAGSTRVCPVDWEMAAVGPGLVDLAALMAGSWAEEQKAALASAYWGALQRREGMAEATFEEALDCCRLHLAVQWLGWSQDWVAPPEHAQDWLQEALFLAQRLRL